jgi:hypothetical protein
MVTAFAGAATLRADYARRIKKAGFLLEAGFHETGCGGRI